VDKDSFYSLIKSGQPENCMIALEIAKALAREDRFFVDFKIALDLGIKYSNADYYENIKVEFLHALSRGQFEISKFRKKSFPLEWYTLSELVNRLSIDYYGGEKLPEGFGIFNKTKELSVYVRSDTTVGEEVAGMLALERYTAAAENDLKISPLIAESKSIKELNLYSQSDYIFLPQEIKNIATLETLKLRSNFEGILLKDLPLKSLTLNLQESRYSRVRELSTVKRIVEDDELPSTLEQLYLNFYGADSFKKFIHNKVFRLEHLTYLHIHNNDSIDWEIGKELLGLKKLKNAYLSRLRKEDIVYFAELPELETIEITCDHHEKDVEVMQETLIKMGSKIKVIILDLPF
jgi:hypothetical protein